MRFATAAHARPVSLADALAIRVTLTREGRLTLFSGAVGSGQGSSAALLQLCADALGLPRGAFDLVIGDADLATGTGRAAAARRAFASGTAARQAGEALRGKILRLAGAGDDARLALAGRRLTVADRGGTRTIDLATLEARGDGVVLEGSGRCDAPGPGPAWCRRA